MIIERTAAGEYIITAQDGTGRTLAGPFPTDAAAWRWIDRNPAVDTPAAQPDPPRAPPARQLRTNKTVTFADVNRLSDGMLARPDLTDRERKFILSMQGLAQRGVPYLRTTDKQAAWWKRLEAKYSAVVRKARAA